MFIADRSSTSVGHVRPKRSSLTIITSAWIVLVGATLLTLWLAHQRVDGGTGRPILDSVGIVINAFVKIGLVIFVFMGVLKAPVALQLIVSAWAVVTCAAILCYVGGLL